jgi:transposase InsO family protein
MIIRRSLWTGASWAEGKCWDNAVLESFFATLKKEEVHRERYLTRAGEVRHLSGQDK